VTIIASQAVRPRASRERVELLKSIEEKWQRRWSEARIFEAEPDGRPKFFVTFPYPYINAYPHLGSAYTVLRVDIIARYKRMRGYNVLFPQGWHATGGPIVAAALRVREGDPKQISILRMMGIPEEEIPKFRDPRHWVEFFREAWRRDFQRYGLSIDWRREFFTTFLNPPYNKFVQWQYNKLRERGLITKGTHPVVWCPKEGKVVGDHDRPDEYVGIGPEEVVIIKFEGEDGLIYPCLTYRPETVYGAVNVWVNPEAEYAIARVDGERWVVSPRAVDELMDQDHDVSVEGSVKGSELVGRYARNPVTGWRVPVLPASFVDPSLGTGVVMSVPAHAPYDYVALEELRRSPESLKAYGVDPSVLDSVRPVSIIRLRGYSDLPAADVVEKLGIESQAEVDKLEEATKEVYTKEYHQGVLKEVFGRWAGRVVAEVKEEIVEELVRRGVALRHYTLPSKVLCRCGSETHVKIVKDQWFLRYSDPEWKRAAHECLDSMRLVPEHIRELMHKQIDWYRDWACTHKGELGTPLPWDPEWVLESLSDSTIYMAYYTISKYLQHPEEYGIDWERLDDGFFDYVFLGRGDPEEVSKRAGVPVELLRKMREEFLYWYPVDLRVSGKDLLPNHLIFFIMHHVAIFPREHWPRGIGINGWVLVGGRKMSKSLGNFITLRQALEWWGADATRFAEAYAGDSGLDDANFEPEVADAAVDYLCNWLKFATENYGRGRDDWRAVDDWFESVLNRTIMEVEEEMEQLNFKSALVKGYFNLQNAFRWYVRRCKVPNRELLKRFIEVQTLILAPITPHVAEEVWERLGKGGFISLAKWPEADESKVRPELERAEEILRTLLEDAAEVVRLFRGRARSITIVVASPWKYELLAKVRERVEAGLKVGQALREAAREVEVPDRRVLGFIAKSLVRRAEVLDLMVPREVERRVLSEALDFIREELGLEEARLVDEDECEEPKAKQALPARPAIIVAGERAAGGE